MFKRALLAGTPFIVACAAATWTSIIPDAGRSVDQNGDNVILATEGAKAAQPRTWTIAERDAHRQTLIDFLQLVRVIEVGMDVDGDSVADIDSSRIYFVGASTGSMIGTLFLALEPSVKAGVCAFTPGVSPEHLRWHIVRRPEIGTALQSRVPSLLNTVDGLTAIDSVSVQPPYFNENKPLRDLPIVINNVPGALQIQHVLELSEMVSESGLSPALWSRYLRAAPLPGSYPTSVVYMFAWVIGPLTIPGRACSFAQAISSIARFISGPISRSRRIRRFRESRMRSSSTLSVQMP
jgi:hypothetical protein